MKSSWPMRKIGEIAELAKGKSSSTKTAPGDYPLVLTASKRKTADHYDFDGEAVLLPLISSTGHGKADIKTVHFQKGKFAAANLLGAIFPDKEVCSPKYLYWAIFSMKDEIAKTKMSGSTNVSMKLEDLRDIKIPLPPLEEQNKIVDFLDTVQKTQELNNLLIIKTEEMFNSYLAKVFSRLPADEVLANVCKIVGGGTPTRSNKGFFDGTIPWITTKDLKDIEVSDGSGYITQEAINHSTTNLVPKDTVLVATRVGLGKIGIATRDLCFNQDIKGLIVKPGIHPRYLLFFLVTKAIRIEDAGYGATIKGINQNFLRDIEIPVPRQEIQQKIIKKVDTILSYKSLLLKQRELYAELFESALHRSFVGELVKVTNRAKVKKTKEEWFAIKQGVGAVLEKLAQTPYERGEMVIAKYMYFLQEIYKVPFTLQFVRHKFGPYDPDIKIAITSSAFNKDKFFQVKGSGDKQVYGLGSNVATLMRYTSDALGSSRTALDDLMSHTKMAKSSDIERLASVCKLVQDFQTTDPNVINHEMSQWKPGKFTTEQVNKSLTFIKSNDWDKKLLG